MLNFFRKLFKVKINFSSYKNDKMNKVEAQKMIEFQIGDD